jgi:flotillin
MAEGEAQAEKFRLETIASGEAERIRTLAEAQAEAITKVSEAMARGGESYLRVRQLELLPQIAPSIAGALANARLINVSNTGNAASGATEQITAVLQTMLTAQLLKDGLGSSPASTELAESDRS